MRAALPSTVLLVGGTVATARGLEVALAALPGPRFRLIPVESPEKAPMLLSSLQCDLLVCDLSRPDESMREVVAGIRRNFPNLPVLAFTASSSVLEDELADETIPIEYVSNPLIGRLARLLIRGLPSPRRVSPQAAPGRYPGDDVRSRRILFVDDDEDLRQVVRRVLQRSGQFQVIEAADGKIGLELAKQSRPDLILADVMMPHVDGFELCTVLRRDPDLRSIPVVLLTARSSVADIIRGFEHGATNYLVKPIQPEKLPELIWKALEDRGNELELLR